LSKIEAQRAWSMTENMHRHLAPAVQLEEKLNWLALQPRKNAAAIRNELQSALRALVAQGQGDIANWAGRALPRLPASVRALEPAAMLAVASDLRLGRTRMTGHLDAGAIPGWFATMLPDRFPQVELGIALTTAGLVLNAAPANETVRIRVPATDPRLVELSVAGRSQLVSIDADAQVAVPLALDERPIALTTLAGERFTLERARVVEPPRTTMIFSLEVVRARRGSCLLLHFGPRHDPGLILIDGGPRGVYGPFLRPRLEMIGKARGRWESRPLRVDLVIASCADGDHLAGLLDLTRDLREAQASKRPPLADVSGLWHNHVADIVQDKSHELINAARSAFGPTSRDDFPDRMMDEMEGSLDHRSEVNPAMTLDTLKILAAAEQEYELLGDTKQLGIPLNAEFDGRLVASDPSGKRVEIKHGLTLTVAAPMLRDVETLREFHSEWLMERRKSSMSPAAALIAYADRSLRVVTSLVLLAEIEGKRMLLAGGARSDTMMRALEAGRMMRDRLAVSVLTVPQDGSANEQFFRAIVADHYVFSGNGEDDSPSRETVQMLYAARGDDADYTLHFSYPIDEIDEARRHAWDRQREREMRRAKRGPRPESKPRENWSPRDHSLRALFEETPKLAGKVHIVNETKPHLIDLLDPARD
jgi:hypothetical protein